MVIINIPYDPLKYKSKTEVSSFLKRLLEVFLILFIGALIIAYFLSRYITKSIERGKEKNRRSTN